MKPCPRYTNGLGPTTSCCDYCAAIVRKAEHQREHDAYRIYDHAGHVITSLTQEFWKDNDYGPKQVDQPRHDGARAARRERDPLSYVGKSGFFGVSFNKATGKYAARIRLDGVPTHIGLFPDAVTAAKAYDDKATEVFGPDAITNYSLGLFDATQE